MFRPVIQKTRTLVFLACLNLVLFIIASFSTGEINAPGYDTKIKAAKLMENAIQALKNFQYGENPVFLDVINDPNETGLVGPKFSHISTGEGNLDSKLSTLNPNFASMIVEIFLEAKLKNEDKVAIAMTGSMPGANIAILSACQVMGIKPYVISSVGSSHWGATDPDFTWVNMEKILVDQNIFDMPSIAASYGGKSDIGGGLSAFGRKQIRKKVDEVDIPYFIDVDRLSESINKRLELYKAHSSLEDYAAYINVGGGAASIGTLDEAREIKPGLSFPSDINLFGNNSVLFKFASMSVPIIHILNIQDLCDQYGLKFAPVPLPPLGVGKLFTMVSYNFYITLAALVVALASLLAVSIYSHNQIAHQRDSYEPESIL